MPLLSIVSPVYKAEAIVELLVSRIRAAVLQITEDFEIILIEDAGPDGSWEKIRHAALADTRVKGVKLSRNFGQHYAISAGLDASRGEWVVVMDCDLQDLPEEIPRLYAKALEGNDIVVGRRHQRKDGIFKKLFSWLFYKVLSYLTGVEQDAAIANFGIYHRNVVDAICSMRESIRYFPTMVRWVGFTRVAMDVKHAPRAEGRTSYNFKKLLNLALDIVLAYSDKPIRLAVKAGIIISFASCIFACYTLVRYFTGTIYVTGYTSLIISIWFLSGLIIIIMGVTGLYIGKTFEGVKARPIYVVKDKVNI